MNHAFNKEKLEQILCEDERFYFMSDSQKHLIVESLSLKAEEMISVHNTLSSIKSKVF